MQPQSVMNTETKLLFLKLGASVLGALGALLTPWARKFLEKFLPQSNWWGALSIVLLLCAAICGALIPIVHAATPRIELTSVPPPAPWAGTLARIAGRVSGTFDPATMRVVVYARAAGQWFVQPINSAPFASLAPDGSWDTETHDGSTYAALLVKTGYTPAATCLVLPQVGDSVLARTP